MKHLIVLIVCLVSALISHSQVLDWAEHIQANQDTRVYGMDTDSYGNVYIVGTVGGTVDFDPGVGVTEISVAIGYDIFICKYSTEGMLIWSKQIGGVFGDMPFDFTIDSNNDLIICGRFESTVDFDPGSGVYNLTGVGSNDVFVLKLDQNGDFIWANAYGSSDYDIGITVATDAANNVFLAGQFGLTIDMDPTGSHNYLTSHGSGDVFIAKLNPSGGIVWANSIGGVGNDVINSIAITQANEIILAGNFTGTVDFDPAIGVNSLTTIGTSNGYLCKLNNNGVFQWVTQIIGSNGASGGQIRIDNSGNLFTLSGFCDTLTLVSAALDTNFVDYGNCDFMLIKYNQNGDFLNAVHIGSDGQDYLTDMELTESGNPIVTGYFWDTDEFYTGSLSESIFPVAFMSAFIEKFDNDLNFEWINQIGNDEGITVSNLAIDQSGNAFWAGNFSGTIDFDPTSGVNSIAAYFYDLFLCKFGQINSLSDSESSQSVSIFPNPSNGIFTVSSKSILKDVSIEISDINGKVIYKKSVQELSSQKINLSIESGIYFISVKNDEMILNSKIIVRN